MKFSRRSFVTGVSASTALAYSGLLGELRIADAEESGTTGPGTKTVRILFNENPLGPSPAALEAIASSSALLGRYPLSQGPQLESKLRKMHGLAYNEPSPGLSLAPTAIPNDDTDLILGVGSSEILKAVAWAYGSGDGNIVEAYPGYSAVGADAVQLPNSKIQRRLIDLDSQNRMDIPAMIDAIDSKTKIVVVCNPNNPTGSAITLDEIKKLADATPRDAVLLVDEAYIEFLPNQSEISAVELAKASPNVLVARTFSKIYGLAGLRIGYGIGSKLVIDRIRPYMLGRLALNMAGVLAAMAALDDQQHVAKTRKLNDQIQAEWKNEFPKLGWKMTPSSACFGWVDVGTDCTSLVRFLASQEILISGGQRWNLPNFVRISIGTEEENERLLTAARSFLKS